MTHRSFVGPSEFFDVLGARQFSLLCFLGLREHHYLLDVGCGSLRAGKLFIPYLQPNRYFGIEPNEWLVKEALLQEVGEDLQEIKKPCFSSTGDFTLSTFRRQFDFVLAHSIFSHASKTQIDRCLSEAYKVMHDHSVFAATFIQGSKNYSGEEWKYPGGVAYTYQFIHDLCRKHGLACSRFPWPHPTQEWVLIRTVENTDPLPEATDVQKIAHLQARLWHVQQELEKMKKHPFTKLTKLLKHIF